MTREVYEFGPFHLDAAGRTLLLNGRNVPLGSRAFDILAALIKADGQVLTQRQLMAIAWPRLVVEDSNIRVQIGNLRKSLGCGKDGARYIASVAGRGYCFVAPVRLGQAPHLVDTANSTVEQVPQPIPRTLGVRGAVPAPLEGVVGRAHNTCELTALLQQHRLLTVLGPGGTGKTTLAVLVAHAQDEFGEAVYFTDLSLINSGEHLLEAVADTLGFRPSGAVTIQGVGEYVRTKKLLLILDNCEHIVDSVGSLCTDLLSMTEAVSVLCTTREALRVSGERIYLMRPLAFPPDGVLLTLDKVKAWPAVQLFVERAEESGASGSFDEESVAIIGSICSRLDGNPLAIELVSSRVGSFGVRVVSELLSTEAALQWAGRRDAVPRHQTVEAMLDWTYELLAENDQLAMNRLSIFLGGFTMDAAVNVISDEKLPRQCATASIADLADGSLLSSRTEDGEALLRLLEIPRTYASSKLNASGERDRISQRHAAYYFSYLKEVASSSGGIDVVSEALREDDLRNVRAAIDWCFLHDHDVRLGVQLSALACPIMLHRRLLGECTRVCLRALSALDPSEQGELTELKLLEVLAVIHGLTARFGEDVSATLKRGHEISRSLGIKRSEIHFSTGLYQTMLGLGRFRESYAIAERYACLAEEIGDSSDIVFGYWMRGISCHFLGDHRAAYDFLLKSKQVCLDVDIRPLHYFEKKIKMSALFSMARAKHVLGLTESALIASRIAIDEARRQGDTLFGCAHMCAPIMLDNGRDDEVRNLVRELDAVSNEFKVATRPVNIEYVKALLLAHRGQAAEANEKLRSCLPGYNIAFFRIGNLKALASTELALGRIPQGISYIEEALGLTEDTDARYELPDLLRIRAELLIKLGARSADLGRSILREALSIARSTGALGWEIPIAISMVKNSATEDPVSLLREVTSKLVEGDQTPMVTELNGLLSELDHSTPGKQKKPSAAA